MSAKRRCVDEEEDGMQSKVELFLKTIKGAKLRVVEGITPDLYELPPFVKKSDWTSIGDFIKYSERLTQNETPGDRWLTLRLDGNAFGTWITKMRKVGAFPENELSEKFNEMMILSCEKLMEKFSAICGYTQSDEMVVVIPAAGVKRGEQNPHSYNGRVQKLCSVASSFVTSRFCYYTMELLKDVPRENFDFELLPTFDCRLGSFKTKEEALLNVLWRSYDCGVNTLSNYAHLKRGIIPGADAAVKETSDKTLIWLLKNKQLPLPPVHAYGTYLVKVKRLAKGFNPITGQETTCIRSKIERYQTNVINRYLQDALFPADDVLPPSQKKMNKNERKKLLKQEQLQREKKKEEEGIKGGEVQPIEF